LTGKEPDAFRTIGELSAELGVPAHILRYWETRFPQLRPLTRAGQRRYYRPADVALVKRIDQALNRDGYTIKGVQKLLKDGNSPPAPVTAVEGGGDIADSLMRVRRLLAEALADDQSDLA
jgi:DNA-binding transcriptional MerR regulator